ARRHERPHPGLAGDRTGACLRVRPRVPRGTLHERVAPSPTTGQGPGDRGGRDHQPDPGGSDVTEATAGDDPGQPPVPEALVERARTERWAERVFERDTSLWSSDPEVQATIAERLGW